MRELLEQEPALVNACWDWGGGDWETALGAAAHMGRKEIARDLLAHGARQASASRTWDVIRRGHSTV